jgi:hypothetical protein
LEGNANGAATSGGFSLHAGTAGAVASAVNLKTCDSAGRCLGGLGSVRARIQLTGQEGWNRSVAWSIGGPLAIRRVFLVAGIAGLNFLSAR